MVAAAAAEPREPGPSEAVDRLVLEVGGEALGATLAADARLLEATERGARLEHEAVHVERAGADPLGDVQAGAGAVGGPDRAGQAAGPVVGDAHGVRDVLELDGREDGPEDLLLGDAHVVGDLGEERGLPVPAGLLVGGATAADDDLGALLLALGDVLLDP